jgi:hypothetical protein
VHAIAGFDVLAMLPALERALQGIQPQISPRSRPAVAVHAGSLENGLDVVRERQIRPVGGRRQFAQIQRGTAGSGLPGRLPRLPRLILRKTGNGRHGQCGEKGEQFLVHAMKF